MIDFTDLNIKLAIAYALVLIVILLMYIAFFKKTPRSRSRS